MGTDLTTGNARESGPPCPVILANRKRCDLPAGHRPKQHNWVPIVDPVR